MASRGSSKARSSAAALEQHCSSKAHLLMRCARLLQKQVKIRFVFNIPVHRNPLLHLQLYTCHIAHTHLNSSVERGPLAPFVGHRSPCSWRALTMPAPLFKRLESHPLPTNCHTLPPGRPYHLHCPCRVNWYNCAAQANRPLWQLQQASCGGSMCLR